MANVFIDEYNITSGVITTTDISGVVYIDGTVFVITRNELYKLNYIAGTFNYITTLNISCGSNIVSYNRKIYYIGVSSAKETILCWYDIDTQEQGTIRNTLSTTSSFRFEVTTLYGSEDFTSISNNNGVFTIINKCLSYGMTGYEPFSICEYNVNTDVWTSKFSNDRISGTNWVIVTPSQYVGNPTFDYGSFGCGYSNPSWGGKKRLLTENPTYSTDRGNKPYLSHHSVIQEYDGVYMVNGGLYNSIYCGVWYFQDYTSTPVKVLELDTSYPNGYVDKISNGQYIILGTTKVGIIHIEPYRNSFTIKSQNGENVLATLYEAPTMVKGFISTVNDNKILVLTGTNDTQYTITWDSETPDGKQFTGISFSPNSKIANIPIGVETYFNLEGDVSLYESYGIYRPPVTTFNVNLYQNTAEANRVDKTNYLTEVTTISGVLREESSITDVTITFESESIPTFNYVYIPVFNRYYFVNDITSLKYKLWQMSLSVDPLMTYKDAILSCNGFIDRNENEYNSNIIDKKRVVAQGHTVQVDSVTNELFTATSGTYVLNGLLVSVYTE